MKVDELIEIEEEIKEDSKTLNFFKKFYILILTFIIVSLLLTNTNTGYHLVSLVSGKIVSSSINEDLSFDLKFGGKVYFEESSWVVLSKIYKDNRKHEFKACLTGYREEENYFVSGVYVPKIYEQDVYHVTSQMCNNNTIISLHSHPPLRCIFSEQDIVSYNSFIRVNPEGIIGLMCGEKTLSFFGYK